ncbi:TolC family protein [Idiomarina baltica]|uniref:Outer membrane protein n=2 Tax=Idiomarinaceae TaxID=267893 RepID=A0ABM9WNM4_9GAMM|nr:Outer membrane protein [Idiomarina baltica OS145]KXS34096.1 MAG: Outer membrane protein [Idiomarina sp. T82-3]
MSFTRIKAPKIFVSLSALFFLNNAFANDLVDYARSNILEHDPTTLQTFNTRSWLAEPITASIMRWQTQDNAIGSDETELLFEFAFLTPKQHELLQSSKQLSHQYHVVQQQQIDLWISGTIRQLFWETQQAEVEQRFIKHTIDALNKMLATVELQVQQKQSPKYAQLIIEQRLNSYNVELNKKQVELQHFYRLWQQYTGQAQLPDTLEEPNSDSSNLTHPSVQAIELQWQLALLNAENNAASQSNWRVTAGVKDIRSVAGTETQLGVGLAIPLTFSRTLSSLDLDALQREQSDINTRLKTTVIDIQTRIAQRRSQYQQLQQQVELAKQNASISSQALDELDALYRQHQIDTKMYIERLIEQLNYQKFFQLTQVQLQMAKAQLNQAQGVSL